MLEVTLYFACPDLAERPPMPILVAVMPSTKKPIREFEFKDIPYVALVVAVFENRDHACACAAMIGEALGLPSFDYSLPAELKPKRLNNPLTS